MPYSAGASTQTLPTAFSDVDRGYILSHPTIDYKSGWLVRWIKYPYSVQILTFDQRMIYGDLQNYESCKINPTQGLDYALSCYETMLKNIRYRFKESNMRFVKFHRKGHTNPTYVNIDNVEALEKHNDGTYTFYMNSGEGIINFEPDLVEDFLAAEGFAKDFYAEGDE